MTLNKAMLIGRLGKDPEIRYTKAGDAVANFTLATDDTWRDKQGNKQERTEWHTIVAWGRLADFVQNYLKKGRQIYVEGRLQTRDWTDQQNVKHYRTEVVANTIRFVGPNPEGGGGPPRGMEDEGASAGPPSGGQRGRGRPAPPQAPAPEGDA
ncbi:MAG TPA: single-stranded DNA-binding protein, partial [bacterium]|nr:single-stranded DNA-binding protein [bacterium]